MERRDASQTWRRDHPWAFVYDRIAGGDRVGRLIWRIGMGSDLGMLHRTAARELSALPHGAAVLDIPCGGGVVLRDVPRDHSLRYVAGDISPAMLERTRREARRRDVAVEIVEADVQDLTHDDATFDLVLAFTSLHCFPRPEQAVHELVRVLVSGGRLAGSTILNGEGVRQLAAQVGGRAIGVLGPGCSRAELIQWLDEAGMVDIELQPSGGITYFTATRS